MSLRYHEIAEANHRILNPFSLEKLMLIGEICAIGPQTRQLDLCCGKAEMIARWSQRWGHRATGVDISNIFLTAGRARVAELGLGDRIALFEADASTFAAEPGGFDIVSCIGATWIGGGLEGTLRLMTPPLAPDGLLLVGEPFWADDAPPEAAISAGLPSDMLTTLHGTFERFANSGFELIEMVLSSLDDWDRYVASQWQAVDAWLRNNPTDPEAEALRHWIANSKDDYLRYGRRYLGWGIFVLRRRADDETAMSR